MVLEGCARVNQAWKSLREDEVGWNRMIYERSAQSLATMIWYVDDER